MKQITDKHGELRLSLWKVYVMAHIVAFFAVVAKSWERKRRREFRRAVPYRNYSLEQIEEILADFHVLATCKDPLIENFYEKHPDFSTLHKLWVLNSSGYWKEQLERRRCELEGGPFIKEKEKKQHEYPTSKKMTWLDKLDYHMVDYFGNQCEVRSLDFFLWWGTKTEHKTFGKLAKKLYVWFTNYYAGLVVPADDSLGRGVEVMPYEHIVELVKRAKVGQIWPCSCKSFRQADEGVPRATCMLIAEVASLDDSMTKYPDMGFMPAEEVLQKLKEFEEIGLVHQIMCVSSPQGRKMYVLCNCDNKACVPMYLKCRYDVPMVKGSGFVCEQGGIALCTACGKCAKRCLLGAMKMENGAPRYIEEKCMGCGLCVTGCPAGILSMRRKATEPFHRYTQEQLEKHPEKAMKL